jgi:hypothetical protein
MDDKANRIVILVAVVTATVVPAILGEIMSGVPTWLRILTIALVSAFVVVIAIALARRFLRK